MGRLSEDESDSPPDSGDDGTTAHGGIRDYVFGPVLQSIHNKTQNIRDLLKENNAKTSSINQNIATLVSDLTEADRDELAPRPSEFTHAMEVEVPADTTVTDAVSARFEPDYDAVITRIAIEFPDGTQQAVGVQIKDAGNNLWVPRGGTRSIISGGQRQSEELHYVQGNDRTISSKPNVRVDEGNPIVAEFINNDPSNNHLIEITFNLEERIVGEA